MKILVFTAVALSAVSLNAEMFKAVSPDGKNEIRLETGAKGMKYSVLRNGKTLVEPIEISLAINDLGTLNGKNAKPSASKRKTGGTLATPVYKKSQIDLAGNETKVDFGDWAFTMHARNDGVAWRYETSFPGEV